MSIKIKKAVRNGITTDTTQTTDINALETVVGDSSSGLVKDVADAESAITALQNAIGDEDTAASILGRIKALEDAATPASESEPTT